MFRDRTVWHSALKKACEKAETGRLRVCISSRAVDSTFPNRPQYIEFRADGDKMDRQYQVDDPAIKALLESIPLGRPVWIQAAGGKGAPTLTAWTDAGELIPQPAADAAPNPVVEEPAPAAPASGRRPRRQRTRPAPEQPHPNSLPAPSTPAPAADAVAVPAAERDTIAGDLWACLLESARMLEKFERRFERRIRPEEVQLAAALHSQVDGVRKISRRPPPEPQPTPDP